MNSNVQNIKRLDDLPDFFTSAELPLVFGISRATAYRRGEDGQIPCLRIGKRRIISRTHLICWINQEISGTERS